MRTTKVAALLAERLRVLDAEIAQLLAMRKTIQQLQDDLGKAVPKRASKRSRMATSNAEPKVAPEVSG